MADKNTKTSIIKRALPLCIGFMLISQVINAQIAMTNPVKLQPMEPLISVNFVQTPLPKALHAIAQKANIGLSYKTTAVPSKSITYRAEKKPVYSVLNGVLKGTGLYYELSKNQRVILIKQLNLQIADQSDPTVSGTVTNAATGKPLMGTSILVVGTTIGTVTGRNGHYSVEVPSLQDTLRFSFIGYKTKKVPINGRTTVNVALERKISQGKDIVVTGKINQKEVNYTGAFTTITGQELRKFGGLANPIQGLANRLSSFRIVPNLMQGSNPNVLPHIKFRGRSTFPAMNNQDLRKTLKGNYLNNPNQPLFILDGFSVPLQRVLNILNSSRIKSITILKDAAAKIQYGARGANGVIVIQTKKTYTSQPVVTYHSKVSFETPDLSSYNLASAKQKLKIERINGYYIPDGNNPQQYVKLQRLYNARKRKVMRGVNTDWLAKPLQFAVGTEQHLSIALGSKRLKMYASLGYRRDPGVMKGSLKKIMSGGINVTYRSKGGNFNISNRLRIDKKNEFNSPYGSFSDYAKMNPYWLPRRPDGSIPYYVAVGPNGEKFTNPLYNSTLNLTNKTGRFTVRNTTRLTWDVTHNMSIRGKVLVKKKTSQYHLFYPAGSTHIEQSTDIFGNHNVFDEGTYELHKGHKLKISAETNLGYRKLINSKNLISVAVGTRITNQKWEEKVFSASGFPSERLDDIKFAKRHNGVTRAPASRLNAVNFHGSGTYTYDKRYVIGGGYTIAGSSRFGSDNRWAKFWTVSAAWNVQNENFASGWDFLDKFKLTASVGTSGRRTSSFNRALGIYNYNLSTLYGGMLVSHISNLANPNLKWEQKLEYNIGFSAKLFNRLSLHFNYNLAYTKHLVTPLTVPPSTGFSQVYDNVGKIRNRNTEMGFKYTPWLGTNGLLSLFFNITFSDSKILSLSEAMQNYNEHLRAIAAQKGNNNPVLLYRDGHPMTPIWAVRSLGIDPANGKEVFITEEGALTYEWDRSDLVVVGDYSPDYRGVFGFASQYKGFGLSMSFGFLGGGQKYNNTLADRVENLDISYNVDARAISARWQEPGDHVHFKRLGKYCPTPNDPCTEDDLLRRGTRSTSRFVQDFNKLSITNITLYYNFSPQMIHDLGLKQLRLSVEANNVATFTSMTMERGLFYPFARQMYFSLKVKF